MRYALGVVLFVIACNEKPAKDPTPPPTTATVTATASASPSVTPPVTCGKATCPDGQTCCNASCGICAPPGGACIQIACNDEPPADAGKTSPVAAKCKIDSECELFSSYCSDAPCMCFAIGRGAGQPKCKTDRPVSCLVDPCQQKVAKCKDGTCAAAAKNEK